MIRDDLRYMNKSQVKRLLDNPVTATGHEYCPEAIRARWAELGEREAAELVKLDHIPSVGPESVFYPPVMTGPALRIKWPNELPVTAIAPRIDQVERVSTREHKGIIWAINLAMDNLEPLITLLFIFLTLTSMSRLF